MRREVLGMCVMIVTLGVGGCVSTHMKQFIGKDVRYVTIKDGDPVNVFDLPDGKRAFQYYWGGGTHVVPRTTRIEGDIQLVGNTAYYSEQRIETGGFVVDNPGCLITYIATWNPQKQGWIVTEVSYPKRAVC